MVGVKDTRLSHWHVTSLKSCIITGCLTPPYHHRRRRSSSSRRNYVCIIICGMMEIRSLVGYLAGQGYQSNYYFVTVRCYATVVVVVKPPPSIA